MRDAVAVYDFDDARYGGVTVVAGGKRFVLAPGRHTLIFRGADKDFEQLNAAQLFAYRAIRQQAVGQDDDGMSLHAFTSEFHLPQAINTVVPLRELVCSQNQQARKIAKRLLKTTSIMSELTTCGEQYHQILRPAMVAMK
jgi:hypothetical protein